MELLQSYTKASIWLVIVKYLVEPSAQLPDSVTSHEHHEVSNHWQLNRLFNSLTVCLSYHQRKHRSLHYWFIVRGSPATWIHPKKGPLMRKVFACHAVIFFCFRRMLVIVRMRLMDVTSLIDKWSSRKYQIGYCKNSASLNSILKCPREIW